MRKHSKFRTIVAFITALCFSFNTYAASPQVVNSLYNYAHDKQITKIRYMVNNMGYNIDVEDEDGRTAWCIAKEKEDQCAMDVLAQMGADTEQRCGLPWGIIGAVAGGAAVIGGVAAAAGGGGGGGSDPCSGVVCGDNQHCQSGSCVCNEGYIDTEGEGVCYPVLECENGVQKGEFCECNEGYVQSADKKSCEVNPCEGYNLTEIPSNATYSDCLSGTTTKYKVESCNTGYELNGDTCVEYDCTKDGYVSGLTGCPTGATGCDTCYSGSNTYYKAKGCNEGYYLENDTCKPNDCSAYPAQSCPSNATCSECKSGDTTKYKIESCSDGYEISADGTECDEAKCEGVWLGSCPIDAICNDTCKSGENYKYRITECIYDGFEPNNLHTECVPIVCDAEFTLTSCPDTAEKCDECNSGGTMYYKVETCKTGYAGDYCDECASGYTMQNGVCYLEKSCNEPHGRQEGEDCICDSANGYTGDNCTDCLAGYGHYGSQTECYVNINCNNGTQVGNACVCDTGYAGDYCDECDTANGYIEQDGVCYKDLNCQHGGVQVGNTCDCTTANGWTGALCEVCSGQVKDGICYPTLGCQHGGVQDGDTCDCSTANGWTGDLCDECEGFEGTDGNCYGVLDCKNGGTQVNDTCDCSTANGYEGALCDVCNGVEQNGVCYVDLNCDEQAHSTGEQDGNKCVCETGYAGQLCDGCATGYIMQNSLCYLDLKCGEQEHSTGEQSRDKCVCELGYAGTLCEECDTGYDFYGTSECHETRDCGFGTQVGNECVCNEGYGRDNTGKCVEKSLTPTVADEGGNFLNRNITKENTGYSDLYGKIYNESILAPTGSIDGKQEDLYLRYDKVEDISKFEDSGNLTLTQSSDGDVIGMSAQYAEDRVNSAKNIFVSFLNMVENVTQNSSQTALIDITNEGNGTVYGIKGLDGIAAQNVYNMAQWLRNADVSVDNVTRSSEIKITNNGTGDTYGMYTGGTANNGLFNITAHDENNYTYTGTNIVTDKATINITAGGKATGMYGFNTINSGDINITAEGPVDGTNAKKEAENSGTIEVTSNNGYVRGMYVMDAKGIYSNTVKNTGTITATSKGEGKLAMGIYSAVDNEKTGNNGTITVKSKGDAKGIFTQGGGEVLIGGNSVIKVESEGTGAAYGIHADDGATVTVSTGSGINVKSANGDAYGIKADGGVLNIEGGSIVVEANGTDSKAYGIYANNGTITNNATIQISSETEGNGYGIYAIGGTVTNTGTIMIDSTCRGATCLSLGSPYIVLEDEASLTNMGVMSTDGEFNFDAMGGEVTLGKGGSYEASSLKGKLYADSSIVSEGFKDEYKEVGALKSENTEVEIESKSAMFEAKIEEGEGVSSVVMSRKNFEELSQDGSIGKYLEENYKKGNNSLLYSELKKASTKSYSSTEAKLLGYSLLPNFAKENLNVIRSLNNVLNEELYDTTGEERKMVGYDHVYGSRDDKGTLSGYENHANTMYFMYDSEGENKIRSGLGMSITQFSSDYEDDSSREEILAQLMMPVSYVQEKGLSYASVLRAGYSDGEYERQGTSSRYEADIKSWVYGMSNSVRYKIKSRLFDIIPTAEFNVMGYYQEEIEENSEKPNSIKIKGENNISVEAGIGMILKKEIEINEISKLKLRAKAMYYHEYGEPYHDLEASVSQMPGSYKIRDIEGIYEKDRGMLSGEIEYIYKPFSFYGNFKQFIEEENPIEVNAGVKYNF